MPNLLKAKQDLFSILHFFEPGGVFSHLETAVPEVIQPAEKKLIKVRMWSKNDGNKPYEKLAKALETNYLAKGGARYMEVCKREI